MNPMVIFIIGLVLFRERGHLLEYIAVGVAFIGVLISTVQYGSFPLVALLCSISWPLYATVKKAANADPIVSIAVETTLLAPFAVIASLIFLPRRGRICLHRPGQRASAHLLRHRHRDAHDTLHLRCQRSSVQGGGYPAVYQFNDLFPLQAFSFSTRPRPPPSSSCLASSSPGLSFLPLEASNVRRMCCRTVQIPNERGRVRFSAHPALFLCRATVGC